MANSNKTFDKAIDELLENYESVIKDAVVYATDRVCEDVYRHAMSCLESYYESYIPNSYDRTDRLWQAILPYAEQPRKHGGYWWSVVGVEYDSSKLDGIYRGSNKYGSPDGSWVLENYLKGIHPATNGATIPEFVEYYEITDDSIPSPYNSMETYLSTEAGQNFAGYLMTYFIQHVAKR